MKFFRQFGPGLLVTAAFIGPGTVTTASQAGASFGYALLWSVVFAVLATIVLQEMAARLGLVARLGLGEAIRKTFVHPVSRTAACGFVIVAIGFGNAAYQTGNLTGAAQGLNLVSGQLAWQHWPVVLGLGACALLITGQYRLIEGVLIALVVLMSLVFIITAVAVQPPADDLVQGMLVPTLPPDSLATVLGLIGTTVVPYNLFLHAASVREKWPVDMPLREALAEARLDTTLAIGIGGLITGAIVTTAAAAFFGHEEFRSFSQLARQLDPLLGGDLARVAFAVGLFAAGLTSAITAPLAAAYAISGILGWPRDLHAGRFRLVWLAVLAAGMVFAVLFQRSPMETIVVAQIANGLLLPIIALFLLIVVNRADLMGPYRNTWRSNLLGGLVVLVAAALGVWKILQQMGVV